MLLEQSEHRRTQNFSITVKSEGLGCSIYKNLKHISTNTHVKTEHHTNAVEIFVLQRFQSYQVDIFVLTHSEKKEAMGQCLRIVFFTFFHSKRDFSNVF